jgi:hypothetical protein
MPRNRLIIQHFMKVQTSPVGLKATTDAWLIILFGGILAIYPW